MTFPQRSAMATIAALLGSYGVYAGAVWVASDGGPPADVVYKPWLICAIVLSAVVTAVSHAILAGIAPQATRAFGEHDRRLARRAAGFSGHVLAVGVCGVLFLAFIEVDYFYVTNALLFAWVVAEVAGRCALLRYYSLAS